MDEAVELQPGAVVAGRYRVERRRVHDELAGLPGVAFDAVDERVDAPVALRVFAAAEAEGWRPRLRRAVQHGRRLDPDGFVRAVDWGELEAGGVFLVGDALRQPLPLDLTVGPRPERLRLLLEGARRVRDAHAREVVHGDLGPGRLVLDAERVVRLAGAGLGPLEPEPTTAGDVAALGRLLHLGLTGELPAEGALHPRSEDPSVSVALDALAAEARGDRPWAPDPTAAWFCDTLQAAAGERATRPDDELPDDDDDELADEPAFESALESGPLSATLEDAPPGTAALPPTLADRPPPAALDAATLVDRPPTVRETAVEASGSAPPPAASSWPLPEPGEPAPRPRRGARLLAGAIVTLGAACAAVVAFDLGGARATLDRWRGRVDLSAVELELAAPAPGAALSDERVTVRGRIQPAAPGRASVGLQTVRLDDDGAFAIEIEVPTEGRVELPVVVALDAGPRLEERLPLVIDRTPPLLELSAPAVDAAQADAVVRLRGRTEDATRVEVLIDGERVSGGPGALMGEVRVELGVTELELVARDAAGNETRLRRRVERLRPAALQLRLGRDALRAGDLPGAARYADRAFELDPSLAAALALRGEVRARADITARTAALVDVEAALELDPSSAHALALRAWLRLARGSNLRVAGDDPELDAALADAAAAIELDPDEALAHVVEADVALARRDFLAAEEAATRACELVGYEPLAHLVRARARLAQVDLLAGQADLRRAAELTRDHPGWATVRALALTHEAGLALEQDDFDAAARRLNEALALDPTIPEAYYYRGAWHHAQKREGRHAGRALSDYNRAIELWPEFADAWFRRAAANFDIGRYEAALRDVERAEVLHERGDAWFALYHATYIRANALLRLERWEEAAGAFRRYLTVAPPGELSVAFAQERLREAEGKLMARPEDPPEEVGPVSARFSLNQPEAAPGDVVVGRVEVDVDAGWRLVAVDLPTGAATRLVPPPLESVGLGVTPRVEVVELPGLGQVEVFAPGTALLARQFRAPAGSDAATTVQVRLALAYTAVHEETGEIESGDLVETLPLRVTAAPEEPEEPPPLGEGELPPGD